MLSIPLPHPLSPCCGCCAWHEVLRQVQVCGNPAGRPLRAVTNCPALPLLLACLQIQPKAAAAQSSALLFQAGSPRQQCRPCINWGCLSCISRVASITLMGSRLQNSPVLVKKAGAGVKMGLLHLDQEVIASRVNAQRLAAEWSGG